MLLGCGLCLVAGLFPSDVRGMLCRCPPPHLSPLACVQEMVNPLIEQGETIHCKKAGKAKKDAAGSAVEAADGGGDGVEVADAQAGQVAEPGDMGAAVGEEGKVVEESHGTLWLAEGAETSTGVVPCGQWSRLQSGGN